MNKPPIALTQWRDLIVSNAETAKDFYQHVVACKTTPVSTSNYNDFNMSLPDSDDYYVI